MEKYDVRFKKRFGQNFLKDINVVKRIVDVSGVNEKSLVIEVGPGGAIMTRELASRVKNVLAYEIDDELSEELYFTLLVMFHIILQRLYYLNYYSLEFILKRLL